MHKYLFIYIFIIFILSDNLLAGKPDQPNIIVFLVDDMGWQDTSVPFWTSVTELNRRYNTPNMERMAQQGAKFTNAYTMSVCTPSRVSLITGVNAMNHRITHWANPLKNVNTDYPDSLFSHVDWNINGFSPEAGYDHTFYATALPEVLKRQGYFTILSGKAHFGAADTPGGNPENAGFDVNIGGSSIGHPASYYGKDNYDKPVKGKPGRNAVPGLEAYHGTDVFLTDALTIEALKAVDSSRTIKKPFFLYLSHYAVHTPLQADPRFVNKYLKAGLPSLEANYASLIEGMDKSLGEVLDYLEKNNLSENTLLLFVSDNGGLSTPPLRGGEGYTHNLPLKAGKGSVYEGGIRVPMLALWPGKIKPGITIEQYVIIEDFFPTILEVAGVKKTRLVQKVDGKSFYPLFSDPYKKDNNRGLLWHHPHRWIPSDGPAISWASAYRKGDWKIVYDYQANKLELFNLKEDIGEHKDLSEAEPEKLKAMAAEFTRILKKGKAQMPVYKSNGKVIKFPHELVKN